MTIFQHGVIEYQGRFMASLVFVLLSFCLYYAHVSGLFLLLAGVGVAGIVWTAITPPNPYIYKSVMNIFWLAGAVFTWLSYKRARA